MWGTHSSRTCVRSPPHELRGADRPVGVEPRFRDTLRGQPRGVWIISLGNLILQVDSFLPVFIVLYLTQRGHSAGVAGLVLGASGLGRVLGNVIGGYLTDTIGRRPAILLSVVTASGLTAIVPFLGPLPTIIAVVGLIGVTSQIYQPAMAAVLVDSVATNQISTVAASRPIPPGSPPPAAV